MREQLKQYVELLFAGAEDCEDMKLEIMQNTLDRYDDLIQEGKVPEAAYRLAITGIGDISEILNTRSPGRPVVVQKRANEEGDSPVKKALRAAAVALYILCPIPLFLLSELGLATLGLCALLAMVAVATMLIILGAKKEAPEETENRNTEKPESPLHKSIDNLIWSIGLAAYLIISFVTGAWHITWLIFPIIGAVKGLAAAILDLREVLRNEN